MTRAPLRLAILPLLLITMACETLQEWIPESQPPEIQLSDGDVVSFNWVDYSEGETESVDGIGLNLSGSDIDNISVGRKAYGSLGLGDEVGGGLKPLFDIPKHLVTPCHVRVEWETEFPGYLSKLVKIDRPIPKKPQILLVIFYPEDRVNCELLASKEEADRRIEALKPKGKKG